MDFYWLIPILACLFLFHVIIKVLIFISRTRFLIQCSQAQTSGAIFIYDQNKAAPAQFQMSIEQPFSAFKM
jgi:hypothetical protein